MSYAGTELSLALTTLMQINALLSTVPEAKSRERVRSKNFVISKHLAVSRSTEVYRWPGQEVIHSKPSCLVVPYH